MDDDELAALNTAIYKSAKEAQIKNAAEIYQIERTVNNLMGGDCDIAELIAVMLMRGWTPPEATP